MFYFKNVLATASSEFIHLNPIAMHAQVLCFAIPWLNSLHIATVEDNIFCMEIAELYEFIMLYSDYSCHYMHAYAAENASMSA